MFTRKRIFFCCYCCCCYCAGVPKSAWLACWPSVGFFLSERFANSFSVQDQTIIKIACIAIKFLWSFNVLKWKSFSDKNSNIMGKKNIPLSWNYAIESLHVFHWIDCDMCQTAIIIGEKITMTFYISTASNGK